jgi:polar amino acid transport system substrate-binding protein
MMAGKGRTGMKSFTWGAGLALALGVAVSGAQARTFEEIKASGKIVIASEGAYPPFNFLQGSKLAGFEIDLGEAIAAKMGVKVEWKALSFDALLIGLRQDRWDLVMASFGITPERSNAVTFTSPSYCSGGVIVAKDAAIRTTAQLAGKVVAVQTGTTNFENVKKLPGIKEVRNLPQDTDARAALQNGRADAWVADRFAVKAALEANPGLGLKMGEMVFQEKIATALKKDNHSLETAYNKALAELMANGTYKAISEKYFKEDIRCK